jgi:hypothetical protein
VCVAAMVLRCVRYHHQLLIPPSGVDDPSQRQRVDIDKQLATETTIVSSLLNNFVLHHVPPRLQWAKQLLARCPYRGAEGEDEVDRTKLVTWDELLRAVQASPAELRQGLTDMGALEIRGHWRVVEQTYFSQVTLLVLGLLAENDWSCDAVSAEVCVEKLPQFCPHVVKHCLKVYGNSVPPPSSNGEHAEDASSACRASCFALDATKVCAWYAHRLLLPDAPSGDEAKVWERSEFLEAWSVATPAGIEPEIEMLRVHNTPVHKRLELSSVRPGVHPR